MLNQITLQGRMVDEPSVGAIIHTANGDRTKYTFTIASQDDYGKQATYYIPCGAWGKTGEFISKWFKKGYMIFITGKLTSYRDYGSSGGETKLEVTVEHADFPPREEVKDEPIEVSEDLPF